MSYFVERRRTETMVAKSCRCGFLKYLSDAGTVSNGDNLPALWQSYGLADSQSIIESPKKAGYIYMRVVEIQHVAAIESFSVWRLGQ
jgi:hypothetical protein